MHGNNVAPGKGDGGPVKIFLCGDVMLGRGIDQILPHPGDPTLHESYMKDARGYVQIAEQASGPIPDDAGFAYIWGYALEQLERSRPDLRMINLETSITTSDEFWKGKGIHYRMNPANTACLQAAGIDLCALANNHVMDWGYPGLKETMASLEKAGVSGAGAGTGRETAEAPAIFEISDNQRIVVFSCGVTTSGIPLSWAAVDDRPGVFLLKDLSDHAFKRVEAAIARGSRKGDIVILSIHWGGNWGFDVPERQVDFARRLIDEAGVDVIHGHSSHHIKGIEVYGGRPVLYGCGDFLNDYEGIGGHERYRGDLSLMYYTEIDPGTGKLTGLRLIPTKIRKFRASRPGNNDILWLERTLNRECGRFGTSVVREEDNTFSLRWGE